MPGFQPTVFTYPARLTNASARIANDLAAATLISGVGAPAVNSDIFIDNVVLLLQMQGPNGSLTLTDTSLFNHTAVMTAGNGAAISTAAAMPGQSSSLLISYMNWFGYQWINSDFARSPGQSWTMECFVNTGSASASGQPYYFDIRDSSNNTIAGVFQALGGSHLLELYKYGNSYPFYYTPSGTGWDHIALTINSSNVATLYVNGVSIGTMSAYTTTSQSFELGYWQFAGSEANANTVYMGPVRVTSGVCRYVANFVPPTSFPNPGQ